MVTRVLLGKFPAGDNSPNGYGLRISKPGYEVTVANPDNEKLVFNSDWEEILPLFMSDTISNGNYVVHGLGFIPFVSATVNIGGRGWEQYVSLNFSPSTYHKDSYNYWALVNAETGQYQERTISQVYTPRPFQRYAYITDRPAIDQCKLRVDTDKLYFDCTSSAQCRYMIYNLKAF